MKLLKRTLVVLIALFLLTGVALAKDNFEVDEEYEIFFTNALYNAPYCAALNSAARDYADELGVDLQIVDGEGDGAVQLNQIRTAVSRGVDGIIYFPADTSSTPPIIRYLNQSDVPYVVINVNVDERVQDDITSFIGTDDTQHGRNLGKIVKEELGDSGNIFLVEGAVGSSFTQLVTKGLEEELAGTNIEIVSRQQANFDPSEAMSITEDWLTAYGEEGIDLIVSQDGGMFSGVNSALEDAGLQGEIPVVAAGSNMIIKEALEDGNLLATSTQDPTIEAELALETAIRLIRGEEVDDWIKNPMEIAYPEDVDEHEWF